MPQTNGQLFPIQSRTKAFVSFMEQCFQVQNLCNYLLNFVICLSFFILRFHSVAIILWMSYMIRVTIIMLRSLLPCKLHYLLFSVHLKLRSLLFSIDCFSLLFSVYRKPRFYFRFSICTWFSQRFDCYYYYLVQSNCLWKISKLYLFYIILRSLSIDWNVVHLQTKS